MGLFEPTYEPLSETESIDLPMYVLSAHGDAFGDVDAYLRDEGIIDEDERIKEISVTATAGKLVRVTDVEVYDGD